MSYVTTHDLLEYVMLEVEPVWLISTLTGKEETM